MSMRHLIPDIVRRLRIPATRPPYIYQTFSNGGLLVGLNAVPLVQEAVPCTYVILVAGMNNLGFIYVGGQNVTATNGVELDAGRAIAFSTPEFAALQYGQTTGSLGLGLARYIDGMGPEIEGQYWQAMSEHIGRARYQKIVLNLRDIHVLATAIDQSLRYIYVSPLGDL
jgi:hypothetical protein